MKVALFNAWGTLNWPRIAKAVAILTGIWLALAELIPIQYFKPIAVVLNAVQIGVGIAMRGTIYGERAQEQIPVSTPPSLPPTQ